MTVKLKAKNVRDIIDAFESRISFFSQLKQKELEKLASIAYYRELLSYYYVVHEQLENKKEIKAFSKEIRTKLRMGKKFIISSKKDYGKWLAKYFLFLYFGKITIIIHKLRMQIINE